MSSEILEIAGKPVKAVTHIQVQLAYQILITKSSSLILPLPISNQ